MPRSRRNTRSSVTPSLPVLYLFTVGLLVETVHLVEHGVQVYQHAWLGWPIAEAQGIVFFLNLEWNHLIFNSLYFAFLLAIFGKGRFKPVTFAQVAFTPSLLVQGYHVGEHVLRIQQHLLTGCEPCFGFLGQFVDLVYLHSFFGLVVFTLPLLTYVHYGVLTQLRYSPRLENLLRRGRARGETG